MEPYEPFSETVREDPYPYYAALRDQAPVYWAEGAQAWCVSRYDDEEHAVRIANDSVYGLAGNVMSGSLERALGVARRLRAGFIGVNGGAPYGADVPFGGYKASGVGRQNGHAGFDQYTELKSVAYPVT